tara:strand:+ start:3665 stop:3850 length:186 start_codon:yes stop_codon:yes gene_type:complete
MKITGLQDSTAIRSHLDELQDEKTRSRNKNLINKFIRYWQLKYFIALKDEEEVKKLILNVK